MEPTRSRSWSALALAGLLGAAGVTHFAKPKPYDAIIPRALPGKPRTWTYASGVAEVALAVAVAAPRTRGLGALLAAGFFTGVFPANVKMAYDYRTRSPRAKAVAYGRLPLQVPLILWALRVRRSTA
ncbi:DoxX family protein [Actinosynnema sp. CS-041913]|uniref:DoxX family protein n=1 Tax=Actinosynnema sp. CS-041913 TaxID=3239917 RepID=UPI003D90F41B